MKSARALLGVSLILAAACSPRAPVSPPVVSAGGVTLQMISATLAEDCGGTGAPYSPPPMPHPAPLIAGAASSESMAKSVCRQTSMQLSVVAGALTAPAQIQVKKVEIFDAKGKSIGELASRSPMVWSAKDSVYQPWDQSVASTTKLSVSYALSAPNWGGVPDRWGQTFVVKATISVAGTETTVQHDVQIETPTRLPPGAVT